MGNQCKKNHFSNNERLFSQTYEIDKNITEETSIINDKINNQTVSSSINNNNTKIESPKINTNSNITNNNKKKTMKSLGIKRKRNNNSDLNQSDKLDGQKNP